MLIIMFSQRQYFCQITNHFLVERNLFKRTKPSPQQYASNISSGLYNNTIFHYRLDYNVNTMTLSKIKGKQTLPWCTLLSAKYNDYDINADIN